MSENVREMSFEEEAVLYLLEAEGEFNKEKADGCDSSGVNNILRRGARIIRKAREEIAYISSKSRPIVYGTWEIKPCGQVATWVCSECYGEIPFGFKPGELKYCPYCGAENSGTSSKLRLSNEREFTIFIREGASLNSTGQSVVGIRYQHKGMPYGTQINFNKVRLEEDEIAESAKELVLSYLDAERILKGKASNEHWWEDI